MTELQLTPKLSRAASHDGSFKHVMSTVDARIVKPTKLLPVIESPITGPSKC